MQVVEQAYLSIDGVEVEVESIEWKHSLGDLKAVKTMNRERRVRGHASGVPEFEFSVEAPVVVEEADINWFDIWKNRKTFTARTEDEAGVVTTAIEARIKELGITYKVGEVTMRKLECVAVDVTEDRA